MSFTLPSRRLRKQADTVRAMKTPGFEYTRSADGTSLAWMRLGTGPTLVMVPAVLLLALTFEPHFEPHGWALG